jgi:hypothetical protein
MVPSSCNLLVNILFLNNGVLIFGLHFLDFEVQVSFSIFSHVIMHMFMDKQSLEVPRENGFESQLCLRVSFHCGNIRIGATIHI